LLTLSNFRYPRIGPFQGPTMIVVDPLHNGGRKKSENSSTGPAVRLTIEWTIGV
jgi:hypothetical protein